MAERLADTLQTHPWLVCVHRGAVARYAYATRHRLRGAYRWSVDTSVYVDPAHHRTGVGRGLYTSLLATLVAQGYVTAFAGIALPNPASVALHESMGFAPIGVYRRVGYKLGRWHDVGWWQLVLRDEQTPPREPVPIQSLRHDPQWQSLVGRGTGLVHIDGHRAATSTF